MGALPSDYSTQRSISRKLVEKPWAFQVTLMVKNPPASAGDSGKNSVDTGAWRTTVPGIAKE